MWILDVFIGFFVYGGMRFFLDGSVCWMEGGGKGFRFLIGGGFIWLISMFGDIIMFFER